jgi:hypothetical protein
MTDNEQKLLKRQRSLIVIIGILLLTTLVSFVYAFVQQGIAQEYALLAQKNAIEAQKNAEEAMRQTLLAQKSAEEARRQMVLAQARVEEVLKKKGR